MMSFRLNLLLLSVFFMAGCGTQVTRQEIQADEGEAASIEVAVRSGIKGQIASNIVQATDNLREMTRLVREDMAQVTGNARLVAGQVTDIADTGVNAGVYLTPRAPAQWEYKVVSAQIDDLEGELNELGNEGWELFSERKEDGKISYIFKRRRADF